MILNLLLQDGRVSMGSILGWFNKTDSELRQVVFSGSVQTGWASKRRVATIQIEASVEVMGDFQTSFFEAGERPAMGQQLGFERAPVGFGPSVVVGGAWSAEAGHRPGLCKASAAGGAGVLAAAVGMDNQTRRGLAQRQGLFQSCEDEFGGLLRE